MLLQAEAGFERRDYCLACEPPTDLAPLATWMTRRPEPAARSRSFDRNTVIELFDAVRRYDRPEHLELRFVLALLLWRRKLLILRDTIRDDSGEIWRFGRAKGDELYDVPRPPLDEPRIEALSDQLDRLLAGEPVEIDLPEKEADADTIPEESQA